MIGVKDAVQRAIVFVGEVMESERSRNALLEEIELSEDRSQWLVTISVPAPMTNSLSAALGGKPQNRDFKILKIDASTGEVASLKIREV